MIDILQIFIFRLVMRKTNQLYYISLIELYIFHEFENISRINFFFFILNVRNMKNNHSITKVNSHLFSTILSLLFDYILATSLIFQAQIQTNSPSVVVNSLTFNSDVDCI